MPTRTAILLAFAWVISFNPCTLVSAQDFENYTPIRSSGALPEDFTITPLKLFYKAIGNLPKEGLNSVEKAVPDSPAGVQAEERTIYLPQAMP